MEEKYSGDIILISRMIEYFPQKSFEWNANEPITLDDVQFAINHHLSEMAIPFGDTFKYPPKKRTSQWHIRRILYFVNHPQEIKNIELDNESSTFDILPVPIIIDGYHRWMAARYLYELGSLHKIHCLYAGREDVLDYLTFLVLIIFPYFFMYYSSMGRLTCGSTAIILFSRKLFGH